jgi:hypothetical protein
MYPSDKSSNNPNLVNRYAGNGPLSFQGGNSWFLVWFISHHFSPFILMPTPEENETQNEFVARCIPIVIRDGTARNTAQAVAVCNYLYQNKSNAKSSHHESETKPAQSAHHQRPQV